MEDMAGVFFRRGNIVRNHYDGGIFFNVKLLYERIHFRRDLRVKPRNRLIHKDYLPRRA